MIIILMLSGSIFLIIYKNKRMKKGILNVCVYFLMSIFLFSNIAHAASVAVPNVKIKKQKDTSVTLQVISTDLAKKDVKIKVKIENQDNDTSTTKTFDVKLKKTGKVDVKIDGLSKDNEYSFKAMIKKSSGGSYSAYSDAVSVNEGGNDSYSAKIGTSNVSSSSFVLKVTSAALKKKEVKIKVRLENKDTDKIETRVLSAKLDKKGIAKVTIDELIGDTEYKVRAAIKKKKDDTYSSFSSEKSITTD